MADIKKEVVCMFPGASIKERLWPIDRWSSVADDLWKMGRQPIIIGGRSEFNMSQEIMDTANSPILNLCGKLSLSETAALFDRSRLLISTDSGILHIGAMCNIPTGAIQKSSDIKEAANLKNYWTHVSCIYNMQGHGLAVKNTGTPCDRGGGG